MQHSSIRPANDRKKAETSVAHIVITKKGTPSTDRRGRSLQKDPGAKGEKHFQGRTGHAQRWWPNGECGLVEAVAMEGKGARFTTCQMLPFYTWAVKRE
jgi:hypothetical protein